MEKFLVVNGKGMKAMMFPTRKKTRTAHLTGARHPGSKLTWKEVDEIRTRYAEGGISQAQLAREYKTSSGNIGRIVRREIWVRV